MALSASQRKTLQDLADGKVVNATKAKEAFDAANAYCVIEQGHIIVHDVNGANKRVMLFSLGKQEFVWSNDPKDIYTTQRDHMDIKNAARIALINNMD